MTSSSDGKRQVISARLSDEAAEGWRSFCSKAGVSLAAFLEVAGLELASESFPPSVNERRQMVEKAREVDRKRRERK